MSDAQLGTAERTPRVTADGDAQVADIPVNTCVRVNAADCGPGQGDGNNTVVPVVAGDATATVDELADGAACLRINGGNCGDTDPGSDGATGSDTAIGPRLLRMLARGQARVADVPADGCVRVNAGDCGDTGGVAGGGATDGDTTVVPVITGDATATVDDVADGAACLRINGGDCGTSGGDTDSGGTGTVAPSVITDADAEVADTPANACVRVNAGDCADSGSGTPNQLPDGDTAVVPVVAGNATSTVDNVADGAACLRINGGDCGTSGGEIGGGGADNTAGPRLLRMLARGHTLAADTPVDACGRVNTGSCDGGSGVQNPPPDDASTVVPVVAGDATTTVDNVADGAACLRINGGDCGTSGGGTSDGGSGGDTGSIVPGTITDTDAEVADTPANGCVRVNAGDCADSGSGTPNRQPDGDTAVVPVVTGDATATADNVADGAACLRINGGDCGDTDPGNDGAGGGDTTTGARLFGMLADLTAEADDIPVNGCVRVNAGDCDGSGLPSQQPGTATAIPVITGDATTFGTGGTDNTTAAGLVRVLDDDLTTGADVNVDPSLPTIRSNVRAAARGVLGVCLSINGSGCSDTDGSGGGGSDGNGAIRNGSRRDGAIGDWARLDDPGRSGFGGINSGVGGFGGQFDGAGDGVGGDQVFGGDAQLASDWVAGDGSDPRLAQTGSTMTTLMLLAGGLLSMLLSALMLGWRRRH